MQPGDARSLLLLPDQVVEFGLVLGLAAGAGLALDHAGGLWLADTLPRVGLDRLGRRKCVWLAFRHGKDEYGIDCAGEEEPGRPATDVEGRGGVLEAMDEREFFNETTEMRTHTLTCPKCGQPGEYKVTWVVRRKRAQLPRNADERDRARFAKAQSYMVRRDDKLVCANVRCRKPFEINTLQSLAFLND